MRNKSLKIFWHIFVLALILIINSVCAEEESKEESKVKELPKYTETIPNTLVKFDMIQIPAGTIEMPDPENEGETRTVEIKPIWIGKTEVTWNEYDVFLFKFDLPAGETDSDAISRPSSPYGAIDEGFGRRGYPVIKIPYQAAKEYCKWLSWRTGKKYRLPTVAEWEYACRAGMIDISEDELPKYAWFGKEKTNPVAKLAPNAWGLYDMLGNVAEWAKDFDGSYVVCGGSYIDEMVHPASRKKYDPKWQLNDPQHPKSEWWYTDAPFVGFRVVRED